MSPLFAKKKHAAGTTALLVDVENGSVGAALARLSREDAPKLFAETRVVLPLSHNRSAEVLARDLEKGLDTALARVSTVAARIRTHEAFAQHGTVNRAALFFSPPWAVMHLEGGTADYVPHIQDMAQTAIKGFFGEGPITSHPFGTAAAHGATALFEYPGLTVLCIASHELTELLLIEDGRVVGRATVPAGAHAFARTLVAHGGMSAHEAHSWLRLAAQAGSHAMSEPFTVAGEHYASQTTEALRELLGQHVASRVLVIAPERSAEVLARSLAAYEPLAEIFASDATVQAMRPHHAEPFIAAHALKPDLPLMLEALFANAKFGIY